MSKRTRALVFLCGAALLPLVAAWPHGGIMPPRPVPPDHPGPVGPTTMPKPNNGPVPGSTGGGNPGPRTGGSVPKSGGAVTGGKRNRDASATDAWEMWWLLNQERFLDLRGRLRGRGVETGPRAAASARIDSAAVMARIAPALCGVLKVEDPDVVDSAVLAIGRSVPAATSAPVLTRIEAALKSPYASARQSALLSLGALGNREALPLLQDVLNDAPSGRAALGLKSGASDLERAFAALAIGLIGDGDSIPALVAAFEKSPASEIDVRSCALLALGLFDDEGHDGDAERIVPFLMATLKDKRVEANTAAQVPIALMRLRSAALPALPLLLEIATAKDTAPRLEESCIIALGELAGPQDREVAALLDLRARDGREGARRFARIALGQLGARAAATDAESELSQTAHRTLLHETSGSSPSQASWAALGLALYGRGLAQGSPARAAVATELADRFAEANDPSLRGALAIGLGLVDAVAAAPALHERLVESREAGERGHCAVALGMLRHQGSIDVLRTLVLDDSDPRLRQQAALALGLLADVEIVPRLIDALAKARTLAVTAALAQAIGLIGDATAIDPLVRLVNDRQAVGLARGFGCVALGLLAEKTELPWNEPLSSGANFHAQVPAVREVLDIY